MSDYILHMMIKSLSETPSEEWGIFDTHICREERERVKAAFLLGPHGYSDAKELPEKEK